MRAVCLFYVPDPENKRSGGVDAKLELCYSNPRQKQVVMGRPSAFNDKDAQEGQSLRHDGARGVIPPGVT